MGILNYLPKFKVVEPNRLTGLVHGHIVAQFPMAADDALVKTVGTPAIKYIENGCIVGLANDGTLVKYGAQAVPFLVFTEELPTILGGNNRFATEEDADGDVYPRGVALYVGDVFTTDNYANDGDYKYAKIVNGVLTLEKTAGENTRFAVEDAILANGDAAKKFIYLG